MLIFVIVYVVVARRTHLRSLLRESEDGESFLEASRLRFPAQQDSELQTDTPAATTTHVDTVATSHASSLINITPLEDLTLQPSIIPVRTQIEEEEEEEEEEEGEDGKEQHDSSERHCDEMGYNADLMRLMQQIQGTTEPH
ncbi:uncharacterized protein [Amphiura filiformis]|uniref:uncharacterized protein n=1 Tax=Amphiura filiformis TaxID=82378 RepID=UPI003B22401A